jgi:hypothetical protein
MPLRFLASVFFALPSSSLLPTTFELIDPKQTHHQLKEKERGGERDRERERERERERGRERGREREREMCLR